MHIVVPFVSGQLQPETEAALHPWPGPVEKIKLADEFAYWRLIRLKWSEGVDFCLVEQDIAPTIAQLRELEDCPEDWCCFQYYREGGVTDSLGCMRVRGRLSLASPGLLDNETPAEVHYSQCDGWLYTRIGSLNRRVHVHGTVMHYRRYTTLAALP